MVSEIKTSEKAMPAGEVRWPTKAGGNIVLCQVIQIPVMSQEYRR